MAPTYEQWRDRPQPPDFSGVRETEPGDLSPVLPDVYAQMETMLANSMDNPATRAQTIGAVNQMLRDEVLNVRYAKSTVAEVVEPALEYTEATGQVDAEQQAREMLERAEQEFDAQREKMLRRVREFGEYGFTMESGTLSDMETLIDNEVSLVEFNELREVVPVTGAYQPSTSVQTSASHDVMADNVDFALGLEKGEIKSIDDYLIKRERVKDDPQASMPDPEREAEAAARVAEHQNVASDRFAGVVPVSVLVEDYMAQQGRNADGTAKAAPDSPEL